MNSILQLKGQFEHHSGNPGGGKRNIPVGKFVESAHILDLINDLHSLQTYWNKHTLIKGALISVYYTSVVAKSNRIQGLLCRGASDPNDSIRGAKFAGETPHIQHVFTYYVGLDVITESITRLVTVKEIVEHDYDGKISHKDIEALNTGHKQYKHSARLAKTNFVNVVVDAFYVQKFSVDFAEAGEDEEAIVTLYRTDVKTEDVFRAIGIDYLNAKQIDENTMLLRPDEIARLKESAPYLIAMKVRDLREVPPEESVASDPRIVQIPMPKQEPVIGVIDTPFYEDVYFKDWVSYESMLGDSIELDARDYTHGTEVTSIIVDGPTINPMLDDGCGRFRVKHFGVAKRVGLALTQSSDQFVERFLKIEISKYGIFRWARYYP